MKFMIVETYVVKASMIPLSVLIFTSLSSVHIRVHLLNHRFPQPNPSIYEPIRYLVYRENEVVLTKLSN